MGCASSVEQQHAASPRPTKQDSHVIPRTKDKEDGSVVLRSQKPTAAADAPAKLPRTTSKQASIKRNQVAPEPQAADKQRAPEAAADTKPPADQEQQLDEHATSVQALGSVAVQSLVQTGLTSWDSRQCLLKHSWQPFIQELQDLSSKVQADRCKVPDTTAKLQHILRRASEWLDVVLASPPTDAACMLEACSNAACQLANTVLQPIVLHAERSLTHSEASSSGSLPRGTRWDTLDVDQLLSALQAGSQSEYGLELGAACEPAKQCAELLVLMEQRCAQRPSLHAKVAGSVVLALDKVVSMLGIVFFKRVVLEEQASLSAKMQQLTSVLSALGLPDNHHLAICLQPHARAMLAGLQQAADHGGEHKVNFQVRRGQAFWDALQQAHEQGLLPAGEGAAGAAGTAGEQARRSCKVFPSFVDEWASHGEQGQVVLEAGEGHGPRKEFFALAAAGMTDAPVAEASTEHAQAQGQSQGQGRAQHPKLFTYNRSAGAFWYNSGLVQTEPLQRAYAFAGWLLGQSIANKAPLGIPLAPVMLQQLLEGLEGFSPDLAMLEAFDPAAATSLKNVAALPEDQLRGMLEMEGLPPSTTPEQYIGQSVRELLLEAVRWQAQALASGFQAAADVRVLRAWCIDAETLAIVLNEGGDAAAADKGDIDIRKVFRVVMDDELCSEGAVLGPLLWQVVNAWPRDRKLQFLQFVTGSSRLPLPGSELLKVEAPFVALGMAEHKAQLGMLPQAHTCDNLLELPNYWDALLQVKGFRNASKAPPEQLPVLKEECARILDERLTLAITCCAGYGLDQREKGADDD